MDFTFFTEQLEKIKEDLQAEITRMQSLRNHEEEELQNLQQKKSKIEIYIHDLESKRGRLEMEEQYSQPEPHEIRNGREHIHLTDDHKKLADLGFPEYDRSQEKVDAPQSHDSFSHYNRNLTCYNSETSISNSFSYHPHIVSSQTLSTTPLSSPALHDDVYKQDNDVSSLKRERSELESQISVMRIQLTRLQTEVTGLENRKTILETMNRNFSVDELRAGEVNGYGVGVDTDVDFSITGAITEVMK